MRSGFWGRQGEVRTEQPGLPAPPSTRPSPEHPAHLHPSPSSPVKWEHTHSITNTAPRRYGQCCYYRSKNASPGSCTADGPLSHPHSNARPLLKGFCLNLNQPQAATILTFISGTFPALGDMHHKAPWRKAWVTLIFQIYFMENKLFYGKLQPCPKKLHKLHMPTTQIPRSSDNQPQSFTHLTSPRLFKKQIPFNMYLWMNSIYHYRTQNHNSMIIPSTIKQLLLNLCQSHTCLKYTGSPIAFFSIICWRNQVICPISLDWALQGASLWYNRKGEKLSVTQSYLTFCGPMDCSLLNFSVHGILQARKLSGEPFPSPGDLPNPGIKPSSLALQADSSPSESPEIHTRNTPPVSYKLDFEAKSSIHPSESTCTLPWGWGWRAGSYWGPLSRPTILLGVCKCMNL